MKRSRRKGMTLIELLVSLAIIVLLAAVALPIFSSYQRQNALKLDTKNLEQLLYYSRTLNNNPSFESRNFGNQNSEKRYGIKIIRNNNKATLHPINSAGDIDLTKEIDSIKFSPRETIEITYKVGDNWQPISGDFIIYISGNPPNEVVSCKTEAVYTGPTPPQPDCSEAVFITISMAGVSTSKTIRIFSTNDAIQQKFSIRVD